MSAPTPGPWHVSASGRYVRYDMGPARGLNVCDLDCFGGPAEERAANARLIAAAPELLAACLAALAHVWGDVEAEIGEGREGSATGLHNQILAAVNKAKGA